jgi:hypothetical protein
VVLAGKGTRAKPLAGLALDASGLCCLMHNCD